MKKARFLAITVACGLLLLQAGPVRAAGAAPHSPAPAAEAQQPCTPLVRLFGQPLCREAMALDNTDLKNYLKSIPEDQRRLIEEQSRLNNVRRVKAEVWQKALVDKFGLAAIAPTDQEIDDYRNKFNSTLAKSYSVDRKTVDLLSDALAKNHYSRSNETKIRKLLDAATMSLKLYGERQQHTESLPKQYQYIAEAAERQTARNMLISWKSDKALFDAYGGKLVTTETGVTPVGAYEKFLKYIRKEGKLEIIDPDYKDIFKETEEFINAKHEEVPDGQEIAAQYFSSPTWQFTLANNNNRFDDLKENLSKIPVLGLKDGAVVEEKDMIGKQSRPSSPILSKTPPPDPGKTP